MTMTSDAIDEYATCMAVAPAHGLDAALRRYVEGGPVVVGHHTGCVLVAAGFVANTATTATMIARGSGILFVAMERQMLRELRIPEMASDPTSLCPGCHVAVDAAEGIGTGISAGDRAETIRRLADPAGKPEHVKRPGHVIPVAGDLKVGAVPTAPQVVLTFASLAAAHPRVAAFTSLVSELDPCGVATPAEGAQMAAEYDWPYVSAGAVTTAYYWTAC